MYCPMGTIQMSMSLLSSFSSSWPHHHNRPCHRLSLVSCCTGRYNTLTASVLPFRRLLAYLLGAGLWHTVISNWHLNTPSLGWLHNCVLTVYSMCNTLWYVTLHFKGSASKVFAAGGRLGDKHTRMCTSCVFLCRSRWHVVHPQQQQVRRTGGHNRPKHQPRWQIICIIKALMFLYSSFGS